MEDKKYHKSGEKIEDIIPKSIPEKDTTSNGDNEIPKKSKSTKKEKSEDN